MKLFLVIKEAKAEKKYFCPLKSGVHLQWKLEVDAFFYIRPERRIAQ